MAAEVLTPLTTTNFAQLTANGVVTGSSYALVAVGFGMIIHIAHRFHIAYAAIYALMAFLAAQIQTTYGWPFVPALIVATVIGVIIAVGSERLVYSPLVRRVGDRDRALFPVFVASLGLSTAIEALINIIWPNPVTISIGVSAVKLGPIHMTSLTVTSVIVTWVAILLVAAVIRWTRLGRMIRAVRVNPSLSVDFGIKPSSMYMTVFAIGTILGGIGAVFLAAQSAPESDMGENLVLYAITAAFIAGAASSPSIIGVLALAMGLIQSWSTFFISSTWSSFVIFAILLIFVMTKAARAVNWGRLIRGRPKYGSGLVKQPAPVLAQASGQPPAQQAPQPSREASPQEAQQRESGVGQ
ncbi:MAG TPA: branched-chain amino acid ABC transporter permease [Streptosporangiaceae bacterium]|jgi:branched-chain amino acid transport system permease protein